MKSFIYLSAFAVLIFTLSAVTIPNIHAIGGTISDGPSCVGIGGTWDGVNTCTVSLTINSGETLIVNSGIIAVMAGTDNSGTIDNSGIIKINGGIGGVAGNGGAGGPAGIGGAGGENGGNGGNANGANGGNANGGSTNGELNNSAGGIINVKNGGSIFVTGGIAGNGGTGGNGGDGGTGGNGGDGGGISSGGHGGNANGGHGGNANGGNAIGRLNNNIGGIINIENGGSISVTNGTAGTPGTSGKDGAAGTSGTAGVAGVGGAGGGGGTANGGKGGTANGGNATAELNNSGTINEKCGATFDNLGTFSGNPIENLCIILTAPPEAFNQFDPVTKNVLVFGRDPVTGNSTGPVSPVSVIPYKGHSEFRTYHISDTSGNSITLVEQFKKHGNTIDVHMISAQYNNGSVIKFGENKKQFHWTTNNGKIKQLNQEMEIGHQGSNQDVKTHFDSKKNNTKITVKSPPLKENLAGMILLRMATNNGTLVIEFP